MSDIESRNIERADRAQKAISAYCKATGTDNEDQLTQATDLLCDLRHFCDYYGVDFDYALRGSYGHYHAETVGGE